MDNAAKALIIAGAILLSILIIALGMMIFKRASSSMSDSLSAMNEHQRSTFNNKFEVYSGKRKGKEVKDLFSALRQNAVGDASFDMVPAVELDNNVNIAQPDSDAGIESDYLPAITTQQKLIKVNYTYDVEMEEYNSGGIVSKISIKRATN